MKTDMRTFTFNELTERARESVYTNYSQVIDEAVAESEDIGQVPDNETINTLFEDWRFTEHGERIA